jgi:hypothetical protein
MNLPYDVARCKGIQPYRDDWIPNCGNCMRRTSEGNPYGQLYMEPPLFVGKCPKREMPYEQRPVQT